MRSILLMTLTVAIVCGDPRPVSAGQTVLAQARDFKRIRSANFVAIGNAGESDLRAALIELERFRAVLQVLMPTATVASRVPNTLVLFRDFKAMEPYMPRGDDGKMKSVGGYYLRTPDLDFMVTSSDRRVNGFSVILHEYMHSFLHQNTTVLPTWLDEGLAEFYASFRMRGERAAIGEVPEDRGFWLRNERRLLPMERIVTPEGRARAAESDRDFLTFYAQSWAFVHYLMLGDRAGQLDPYLKALQEGKTEEAAFRQVFGVSFEQMRRELEKYLARPTLNGMLVEVPPTALNATLTAAEPLTEAQAQRFRGSLLANLGPHADENAEAALQRSLALEPADVDARITLALLRWRQSRLGEALTILDRLSADAPDDHRVHRLYAEVRADNGRHEQALASAMRAAELKPDVPVVWMLVSLEAAILGQAEQSRVALATLRKLDSDPTWLASRAARAYRQDQWTLVPPMVEAFAREVGWPSQDAHYLGFKSALALYRLERHEDAVVLLDRIAAALPPKSWASSVAAYLKGTLDEATFVDRAKSLGERTEARAYVGLMAAIKGRRVVATTHLRWVAERGSRTYAEYEMALDELKRLGDTP